MGVTTFKRCIKHYNLADTLVLAERRHQVIGRHLCEADKHIADPNHLLASQLLPTPRQVKTNPLP